MGVLRKQFSQIWLMALAGVLIASLLTALLIMLLRPTWPFNVAWLIGTIMSATDPVAVVALLKDLGTDKAVGTLIEGESLLNDGSAVVLFSWIRNWIYHTNSDELPYDAQDNYPGTWVDLTRIVAQMLLFGILYGWVCGAALATILRRTYNDPIVEISLTIGGAYVPLGHTIPTHTHHPSTAASPHRRCPAEPRPSPRFAATWSSGRRRWRSPRRP